MVVCRHFTIRTDVSVVMTMFSFCCRNHGALLQDLVSVLLRTEPSERPSAKQILHIPAMHAYVNKVLARGRTQRSESVSCSEGQSVRKGNVWRKPDVISSVENESKERPSSECDVDVFKRPEEKSSKFVAYSHS